MQNWRQYHPYAESYMNQPDGFSVDGYGDGTAGSTGAVNNDNDTAYADESGTKACGMCTFINPASATLCEMCTNRL